MPVELESVFRPTPPQATFLRSAAKIRGFGGAMGGGKSRTMCEAIFDYALDHPGITALIARDKHTSIVESTKKTMTGQVIPKSLIVAEKKSMGEDWLELYNGSRIHFIGMDDPYRWYSTEISIYALDEAQEIENHDEEKVIRLITRLRERCHDCVKGGVRDCVHFPHKAMISFNPSNPGHWLQKWFILGGERTEHGFKKDLYLDEADEPLGSCEFVFALAADNPYLGADYMATLRGLKPHLRRRYLEGKWEFLSNTTYFDSEAIQHYEDVAREFKPICSGRTKGDVAADFAHKHRNGPKPKEPVGIRPGDGPLTVFRRPVRTHINASGDRVEAHRYILAADASSGRGADFTGIQILDIDAFEIVAELQGKLEPDLAAVECYRLGRIYNDALIVTELTGGWGFSLLRELERLGYRRLYTRKTWDRLAKKFTDKLGWDTTQHSRNNMLDVLERVLREKELGLYSLRTVHEMMTFVYSDKNKPEAQPGCNDDLIIPLAIVVTVAGEYPRQVRRVIERPHRAQFATTGY